MFFFDNPLQHLTPANSGFRIRKSRPMIRVTSLLIRQVSLRSVLLAILVVGLVASAACSRSPRKQFNVLFIVIDTLRSDNLGCYGQDDILTPHIDAFSAESLLFERAYAQSSWTKSSVASYLTGIYPQRHQVFPEFGDNSALPDQAVTLAEVLQGAGYQTAGISANPNVSPAFGFAQGFASFQLNRRWEPNTTLAVAKDAVAQLDSLATGDPFFLYVHFLDPHDPYTRVPGYKEYFSRKPVYNKLVKEGQVSVLSGEPEAAGKVLPVAHHLTPFELDHLRALYKSEVSQVDEAVGRILAKLEAHGLADNTLVIVTSDHGEEFLEHDFLRHGYQLFEETVRVPLIIRAPAGLGKPGRHESPVELIDVMPTVLDFLGIEADSLAMDGQILPPRGKEVPGPGELAAFGMTRFRGQDQTYLIIGNKKLIHNPKTGANLLFDLKDDPAEAAGTPAESSPEGRTMIRNTEQLLEALSSLSLEGLPGQEIDPKLREQLKSLGYTR